MICDVNVILVYKHGVPKDSHRDKICAEVVRRLIEERKRQNISGNVLAERAGLSQSLISSLETNPWNPTLDTLLRIGDVLQLDIGEMISQARGKILSEK